MYNIANTLYHPFNERIRYNTSVDLLNEDVTIQETNNGYDAEIKNLDLSFLNRS